MCSQYNRNKLHSTNINIKFVQQGKNTFLVSVVNSYKVFTFHSQLYNQLYEHSQNAYDLIRLMRSKAAVWTVDDVARLIKMILKY